MHNLIVVRLRLHADTLKTSKKRRSHFACFSTLCISYSSLLCVYYSSSNEWCVDDRFLAERVCVAASRGCRTRRRSWKIPGNEGWRAAGGERATAFAPAHTLYMQSLRQRWRGVPGLHFILLICSSEIREIIKHEPNTLYCKTAIIWLMSLNNFPSAFAHKQLQLHLFPDTDWYEKLQA